MAKLYRHAAHVVAVDLDGETVIWNERDGTLHALNQSATSVWQLCEDGRTAADIARIISDQHHLPQSAVLADVSTVLRDLTSKTLLRGTP